MAKYELVKQNNVVAYKNLSNVSAQDIATRLRSSNIDYFHIKGGGLKIDDLNGLTLWEVGTNGFNESQNRLRVYGGWNGGDGTVELHGDRPSLKFVYDNATGNGKNEMLFLGTGIAGGIRIIMRPQGGSWTGVAKIYENGDIELEQQGRGLILKGDDGNRYRIKIDSNGQLVAIKL